LGLGIRPDPPRYRTGVRCRYMMPETRRILSLLRSRGRLKNRELASVPCEVREYFRQFLSLRSRYYVLTFSDPRPFFADILFAILRTWRRYLRARDGSVGARSLRT
jgi:hypothetical protein